jgi:hypothetical protein
MTIFEKIGFIRKQEVALVKKLLVWKYKKSGTVLPDEKILSTHAEKIVNEAHIIAKESGSNILDIIKENVKKLMK